MNELGFCSAAASLDAGVIIPRVSEGPSLCSPSQTPSSLIQYPLPSGLSSKTTVYTPQTESYGFKGKKRERNTATQASWLAVQGNAKNRALLSWPGKGLGRQQLEVAEAEEACGFL